MNDFNPQGDTEIKNGFRVPLYQSIRIDRLELNWNEHLQLPFEKHTLSLNLKAGSILEHTVDDFFDFYIGGFIGMRGYPFYALGGNEMVALSIAYRFPISTDLNFRILQFYFKKLYTSVFYDIGNAWNGAIPKNNDWKKDAGFELRLETFSWYAYPTRIFFSGAYGFDRFSRYINDMSIGQVMYGKEWRFYLGILFGFELNDLMPRQFLR